MNRSLCVFVAILLPCAVLSAPAPKPFFLGWGNPVDPDNDCKIRRDKGILTIEMPGIYHDYSPCRNHVNAPRLLREIEGDFEMQVRIKVDCRPSVKSTANGKPSYVSAGFLIILPENFWSKSFSMEYRVTGQGDGVDGCIEALDSGDDSYGRAGVVGDKPPGWPFKGKPDYVYLRLERWGMCLFYQISSDGKSWVNTIYGSGGKADLPPKLNVGLHACSTSTDPSKVQFDQLKVTIGRKLKPWEFVTSWSAPVDPDKDCKIQREKDSLTIEMPGTLHDYDPICKRYNAPRLLADLKGDFDLQVRVHIDYRPSKKSTAEGLPSFVSGGFLFIYPDTGSDTGCIISDRLEYGVSQNGNKPDSYAAPPALARPRRNVTAPKGTEANSYVMAKCLQCLSWNAGKIEWANEMQKQFANGALWDRGWQNWPLPDKADCAYLRLELRDQFYYFLISPDGKKWTQLTGRQSPPEKRKLALAAYSTSPNPSKVRFDQLKLWRPNEKKNK